MKKLFVGILLLLVLGIGGFFYRAETEKPPSGLTACSQEAKTCPDGSGVGRTGPLCAFPACPLPNVELETLRIAFALPEGYASAPPLDASVVARYVTAAAKGVEIPSEIQIRVYPISASSTALATIQASAILDGSGALAPATAYSSVSVGTRRFTVVTIGRFEGVVDVAYYLARGSDVLRFDAIDRGVDGTNPDVDSSSLPAAQALKYLLGTLQGG